MSSPQNVVGSVEPVLRRIPAGPVLLALISTRPGQKDI